MSRLLDNVLYHRQKYLADIQYTHRNRMPDDPGGPLTLLAGLEQKLPRIICAFHIAF